MSDLPPDLPRLRTLETWLALHLEQVRRAIVAAEEQEAERARGEMARPPQPDWLVELGIGRDRHPILVHVGGCHMAGRGRTSGKPLTSANFMPEAYRLCQLASSQPWALRLRWP